MRNTSSYVVSWSLWMALVFGRKLRIQHSLAGLGPWGCYWFKIAANRNDLWGKDLLRRLQITVCGGRREVNLSPMFVICLMFAIDILNRSRYADKTVGLLFWVPGRFDRRTTVDPCDSKCLISLIKWVGFFFMSGISDILMTQGKTPVC